MHLAWILVALQTIPNPLRGRLRNVVANPPHLEASLYGPLDKLFNTIYSGPDWMVKPQAEIRAELPELVLGEDAADTSIDSYNSPVGGEASYPDFAVSIHSIINKWIAQFYKQQTKC
jgi:hypothetical protein